MDTSDAIEEFHGVWWRPEAPDDRVGGVMTMTPGKRGSLRVHGELTTVGDYGLPIVFGDLADGRKLTVSNVSFAREVGRPPATTQEFMTGNVLIGMHLEDLDARVFSYVTIKTKLLREWMPLPNPHFTERGGPGKPWSVILPGLDPLIADVPGLGRVVLGCGSESSSGNGSVRIDMPPVWDLDASEPMSLQEVWRTFLAPVLFLMTLATGERESVIEVNLFTERDSEVRVVEWFETSWLGKREPGPVPWLRPCIPFALFSEHFVEAVPRWFELYENSPEVFQTYFSGQMVRGHFVDDRFSNTVRAMEAWHRGVDAAPYLDKAKYRQLVKSAIAVLPKAHQHHFRERLANANEISLRERLEKVVEMSGPGIAGEVEGLDRFISRVVATRNAQAHRAGVGDEFDDEELVSAAFLLEAIFEGALARQIGLPDHGLARAQFRTARWGYISQLALRRRPSS